MDARTLSAWAFCSATTAKKYVRIEIGEPFRSSMSDDEYHIGFYEAMRAAHQQFLMAWGNGSFDDGESNPLALVAQLLMQLRDSAHKDVETLEGEDGW